MPLSDTKLRNIAGKPYDGKPELADRDSLSVRITTKGTITWQYRFRWRSKHERLTMGRYPDISLKEAREMVPDIRGIISSGLDPRTVWRPKSNSHTIITAEKCVDKFMSVRAPKLKEKTQTLYKSVLNKYYKPLFPGRAIDAIPLDDWLDWFDSLSNQSPVLAGSVLRAGKTMFNWCHRRRMIALPEMMTLNVDDVGSSSETGERVLSVRECREIWRTLDQRRASAATTICIKLCMLLGCRQVEIREAHRSHFDMSEHIWTVPKELSKTNKPIARPITPEVAKLIKHLWAIYGEDGYLLPNEKRPDIPISPASVNKLIKRLNTALKEKGTVIHDWRSHDFRRTLSTRLSEAGVLPHVTEKMLGHKLQGVMAVYNKHDWIDDQRKAYTLWEQKIIGAVNDR